MTMTAKRKSTEPRKAAKARVNGAAESPPLPPATAEELRAPQHETDPTPAEPTPERVEPSIFETGDKPTYVFKPLAVQEGDSMEPIIVPHITTLNADVEFFWELDNLDPMHQAFRYMARAEIPRAIQRRVVRLPQEELARFLNEWFRGVLVPQGVGPPGES